MVYDGAVTGVAAAMALLPFLCRCWDWLYDCRYAIVVALAAPFLRSRDGRSASGFAGSASPGDFVEVEWRQAGTLPRRRLGFRIIRLAPARAVLPELQAMQTILPRGRDGYTMSVPAGCADRREDARISRPRSSALRISAHFMEWSAASYAGLKWHTGTARLPIHEAQAQPQSTRRSCERQARSAPTA